MKQVEGKAFVGFHDCLVEHSLEISSWVNHLSCLCQYTWAVAWARWQPGTTLLQAFTSFK